VAVPCATENEIDQDEAAALIANGVKAVVEGANMPTELAGVHAFIKAQVLFAPAKAANAGGVAVSGLEQSQNALRLTWSREEVDDRLQAIMGHIHDQCVARGNSEGDYINYVKGANIAGFVKVADTMLAYGAV
jgi:glutamate dehydrogenase (NADP+)